MLSSSYAYDLHLPCGKHGHPDGSSSLNTRVVDPLRAGWIHRGTNLVPRQSDFDTLHSALVGTILAIFPHGDPPLIGTSPLIGARMDNPFGATAQAGPVPFHGDFARRSL